MSRRSFCGKKEKLEFDSRILKHYSVPENAISEFVQEVNLL